MQHLFPWLKRGAYEIKISLYTCMFKGVKGERLKIKNRFKVLGCKNPNLQTIFETFEVDFLVKERFFLRKNDFA